MSQEMEEEMYEDGDAAYERYRDDWGDRLTEVLTDTYNTFVRGERGYYKDADWKFFQHAVEILEDLTKQKCQNR